MKRMINNMKNREKLVKWLAVLAALLAVAGIVILFLAK